MEIYIFFCLFILFIFPDLSFFSDASPTWRFFLLLGYMGHVARSDGPLGRLAAYEMPTGRHGPRFGESYFWAPAQALFREIGMYISERALGAPHNMPRSDAKVLTNGRFTTPSKHLGNR